MLRFSQLRKPATWLPMLAWLVALSLAAWFGAYWYWRLAAPAREQSQYSAPTNPAVIAKDIASRHLFGALPKEELAQQVDSGQFKLIGVAANTSTAKGFAVIQPNNQPGSIAAIEGEEFTSGVKLLKVNPTSVEISRGGVKEILTLSKGENANIPSSPVAPQVVTAPYPTGSASSPNNTNAHSEPTTNQAEADKE